MAKIDYHSVVWGPGTRRMQFDTWTSTIALLKQTRAFNVDMTRPGRPVPKNKNERRGIQDEESVA